MARNDNNVILEHVLIVFRNFAGEQTTYNALGNRNFSVVLDDEQAERMKADGWNVKTKPPREEGDPEFHHLPVTVSFKGKSKPRLILISSRGRNTLDEDSAELFDWADFDYVDLIIRPYDWGPINGKSGRKAYLVAAYGVLHEDPLMQKYAKYDEIRSGPDVVTENDDFIGDVTDLDD